MLRDWGLNDQMIWELQAPGIHPMSNSGQVNYSCSLWCEGTYVRMIKYPCQIFSRKNNWHIYNSILSVITIPVSKLEEEKKL